MEDSRKILLEVAEKLAETGTAAGREAVGYLKGICQELVQERQRYVEIMRELTARHDVPFARVEAAARLWELDKQQRAATWPGTRHCLREEMVAVWARLCERSDEEARMIVTAVYREFAEVLSASSPVEWAHGRIAAVMRPQKRMSSGFLNLRTAFF
ncbi:MAG: hypothetical protein HYV63_00260 [Candidatus Schekmanbacteria bacterium]|nr:hypothetical protein [Candidatus Schekmanbacteria bacterium]